MLDTTTSIVTRNSTYVIEEAGFGVTLATRYVHGVDSLGEAWPHGTTVGIDHAEAKRVETWDGRAEQVYVLVKDGRPYITTSHVVEVCLHL